MKPVTKLLLLTVLLTQALTLNELKNSVFDLAKDETNPTNEDLLQKEIDQYHLELSQELKAQEERNQAQLTELLGATQYVCTGGKSPSSMSRKDYVKAFNVGPCAPIALLAGITGTKLVARIDCEVFKANHPVEFSKCFSSCTGLSAPKKEYRVWVPHITEPMSILKPSDNSRACFAALVGNDIELMNKTGESKPRKGITVYPLGLSPETTTKATSDCGMEAVTDLAPTLIQISGYSQYRDLYAVLKNAGYISGLTVQALPYDWRISYKDNSLNQIYPKVLKRLWENTGKKVLIVAHSFGNMQTAHTLWKMPQADKDTYIARYIALAPPYIGSSQLTAGTIGYDSRFCFNFGFFDLGITPQTYKDAIADGKGMFNLMPKKAVSVNAGSNWWKAILGRMQAEYNNQAQPTGTIMDIFPPATATCAPYFKQRDAKCKLNLVDMDQAGSVNKETVTGSNLCDILGKYGIGYKSQQMCQETADPNFDNLPNLGVQTNIVFGATIGTPYKFNFASDPRPDTRWFKVVTPTWEYTYGDGSVNTASALIPGIKWAQEFKDNKPNAKPVTFIEVCSSFNERKSVFKAGKNKVEQNEYIGLNCQCKGNSLIYSSGTGCDHVKLVSDAFTVEFILNTAIDYQTPVASPTRGAFELMTSAQIEAFENKCALLTT